MSLSLSSRYAMPDAAKKDADTLMLSMCRLQADHIAIRSGNDLPMHSLPGCTSMQHAFFVLSVMTIIFPPQEGRGDRKVSSISFVMGTAGAWLAGRYANGHAPIKLIAWSIWSMLQTSVTCSCQNKVDDHGLHPSCYGGLKHYEILPYVGVRFAYFRISF